MLIGITGIPPKIPVKFSFAPNGNLKKVMTSKNAIITPIIERRVIDLPFFIFASVTEYFPHYLNAYCLLYNINHVLVNLFSVFFNYCPEKNFKQNKLATTATPKSTVNKIFRADKGVLPPTFPVSPFT